MRIPYRAPPDHFRVRASIVGAPSKLGWGGDFRIRPYFASQPDRLYREFRFCDLYFRDAGCGLVVELLANVFQRRPARIVYWRRAGARFYIAVHAAGRAQALTVVPANHLYGDGQQHLLAQHIFQQKALALVVADLGFRRGDLELLVPGVGALRAVEQLKFPRYVLHHRIQAARAG